ncbi:MAG: beta-ketoacyl synthase N-terminal-like domain-containing protein, partial [Pseudonocardiaceae bacterium]
MNVEVVISGIGIIAPTGLNAEAHWQAVLDGKSGIRRITRFDPSSYPVQLAGEITEFDARDDVPARLIPQTDRWTHLALQAAKVALDDAGVDPTRLPEYEMAVVTSSSSGGTEFGQQEIEQLWRNGPSYVGAYQSIAWFYAATTGQVSIRHQMRGPCGVLACEQAGGLDAIGQSRRLLGTGSRLVVSGGTDSSLCPYGLVAQLATGRLSVVSDSERAYLPFDARASGYLPGEGGAILILEQAQALAERGGRAYGTVLGYAAGFDPPPGSPRPPALRRVIELALADAEVPPEGIDVVFADAQGTVAA